ncbi:MAG TPA: metal ABC transporter substrate-binding protein [Phycisphaerales bacterium]|nr:metal ABC transporter substrate-binding protein [Phycisphaerales bacterium]
MNRRRASRIMAGLIAGCGFFMQACKESSTSGPRAGTGLKVVVTIAPLSEIAGRLAPAGSDVKILMPPGRSEHGYEFTPADLANLASADVVVYVGLGLEPQVEKFLADNPSRARQTVSFARAVGLATPADDGHGHEHAHEHVHDHGGDDHDHGGVDPHLWLDPIMVRQLVPVVSGAMNAALTVSGRESPEAARTLVESEEKLLADVDAIDRAYREQLAAFAGRSIVTHHSAWGRLAERYGLKVASVLRPVESAEPTPGQVTAAVGAIKSSGAKAIFVEPQFDAAIAKRIADEAGIPLRTLDPLGSGDWCGMMRANLKELAKGL